MGSGLAFGGSPYRAGVRFVAPQETESFARRPATLLSVLLHASRLDRQLAEGADPAQSRVLSLRARQLQGMRLRRSLARGLERDVKMAERCSSDERNDLPISQTEVATARPLLLRLIERLSGTAPVSPRGVAMVRRLLTDSASPIFSLGWRTAETTPGALRDQARLILAVFDGLDVHRPEGDRAGW